MNQIERQYGIDSPKARITKNLKEYVQVERKHEQKMTDQQEFLLYVLRRFTNGFCPSQEKLSELTGFDQAEVSKVMKALERLGFIAIYKRSKGRSNWYELKNLPIKNYNKIPNALILNAEIPWKSRLFAIKLYDQVLNDVNEIHYTKAELAEKMGMARGTLSANLKYFEDNGIIEPMQKGYRVDVYKLLCIADDLILKLEQKLVEKDNLIDTLQLRNSYLEEKLEKAEVYRDVYFEKLQNLQKLN